MNTVSQPLASATPSGAAVAMSSHACRTLAVPTLAHNPIQLHADAHKALNMAVFYLRQPQSNLLGARRKTIQALSALRNLSAILEG
jgi:hypothetical protein